MRVRSLLKSTGYELRQDHSRDSGYPTEYVSYTDNQGHEFVIEPNGDWTWSDEEGIQVVEDTGEVSLLTHLTSQLASLIEAQKK
jgi:hypothetical protein